MVRVDMEVHIIEYRYQVTENMLGIQSTRVLKEEPKNSAKTVNLYGISPHHLWLVGWKKLEILYVKFPVVLFHLITF